MLAQEWNKTAPLSELLEAYSSFDPKFKAICKYVCPDSLILVTH